MCGVGGYTGLGHLSAELRYDLVEALGIGLDKRGGHAAGAVTVPEEGPPRLMRKLGTWSNARGRFVRAAAQGHSVMMHTRYATTGSKDSVENAHPFAVKRKNLEGEDRTVLYGCHNGMIHGTWETAKKAGREHTVDSREFFELLADAAYETIRALSGYGVVTFVRPEDRAVRVLRLTKNSDFHAVRLVGGGVVWGSTETIVKEALEYAELTVDSVLDLSNVGRVFRLSGTEATETKLDNIVLNASQTDKRTSGGSHYYSGDVDWENDWTNYRQNQHGSSTGRSYSNLTKNWSDACYHCGAMNYHDADCKFRHSVVPSESIGKNWEAYRMRKAEMAGKKEAERLQRQAAWAKANAATVAGNSADGKMRVTSRSCTLCDDDTYRPVDLHGKVIPYAFPIYVKDSTGSYVACLTYHEASKILGKSVAMYAEPKSYPGLGQRRLTEEEIPKPDSTLPSVRTHPAPAHNGSWCIPNGLSDEERKEWVELLNNGESALQDLLRKTEEADLEDAAQELEAAFARNMKGDA